MKRFFYSITSVIVLFACESNIPNIPEDDYVQIGFTAQSIEFEDESLTRAYGSNDLYGLQIYECIPEESSGLTVLSTSACWVTDDISKSSISLRKNKKYLCNLVYIPNGQNLIYSDGTGYGNPFFHLGPNASPVYDVIHYGSYYDMNFAGYGASMTKDKRDYRIQANWWNQVDIYYGYIYITASESETVEIDLYRMMFGLNVKANNLNEGKLVVYSGSVNDSYQSVVSDDGYVYEITPLDPEIDVVLELINMPWEYNIHNNIEMQENGIENWGCYDNIRIDYVKPTGEAVRLVSKNLYTTRMKKYIFNIDMASALDEVQKNFTANIIEDDWSEEHVDIVY